MKIPFTNIDISRRNGGNKLIGKLLWPFSYNKGLLPDSNFANYLKAYTGWVYTASSKNATAVASTPIRVYAGKPNTNPLKNYKFKAISREKEADIRNRPSLLNLPQVKQAVEIVEILEHPMLQLFRHVNSYMNQFSLFEITDLYQELCGNAYWYILKDKLGIPRELWVIPPASFQIIPDPIDFIKGYVYGLGLQQQFFEEGEIVHFKMPSPTNVYYGQSPLSAVTSSYNISRNINRYENFIFQNMGRLEGAFETDNELSTYEFERLKQEIDQTFRGTENVGKSPLLEKGVKYKSYGATPKDLSFLRGRPYVKEEILNAYGQSLGLWDKDSTRANATVANENFMRDAIRPRLIRTEEKINEKLSPQYDENLFVAFDNPVPIDPEFRLKQVESHLKSGYSNINMEREEDNKDPVPWGDKPILNKNMVPLGEGEGPENEDNDGWVPSVPDEEGLKRILSGGIEGISNHLGELIIQRLQNHGR